MSALPEEALLGSVKRMFQNWYSDADGLYHSRCTITRDDGVPETFDGNAMSPAEAKKKAIRFAAGFIFESAGMATSTKSSHHSSSSDSVSNEPPIPRRSRFADAAASGAPNGTISNASAVPEPTALRSKPPPLRSQPPAPHSNLPSLRSRPQNLCSMQSPAPSRPPPLRSAPQALPPMQNARQHQRAPVPALHYGMQSQILAYGRTCPSPDSFSCLPGAVPAHTVPQIPIDPYYHNVGAVLPHVSRHSHPMANDKRPRHINTRRHHQSSTKSDDQSHGSTSASSTASVIRRSKKLNPKLKKRGKTPEEVKTPEEGKTPESRKQNQKEVSKDVQRTAPAINYMSQLNVLMTKFQNVFGSRKISFEEYNDPDAPELKWLCTMEVKNKMAKEGEDEDIVFSRPGHKKMDCKQRVAESMLNKLNELLDLARATEDAIPRLEAGAKDSQYETTSEENAISILHAWWQKNFLLTKPDFDLKQADDVNGEFSGRTCWRCTYIAKVKGVSEELPFRSRDSVKTTAKKKAAAKAVKYIRGLKLPGFEEALVQKRQDPQRVLARMEREEPCPENTKDMCQDSDESDAESVELTKESVFSLPPNFSVEIAKTKQDCDSWVSKHVTGSNILGIYVDSLLMRMEMLELAERAGCDAEKLDDRDLNSKVICMATDTSALLLCTDFFMLEGDGEVAIPKSVQDVLANPKIQKIGMWPEAAAAALRANFSIDMSDTENLSVISYSMSGLRKGSTMHNTTSIVDLWLKENFQPFSKTAIADVPGLQELISETDAMVHPAVYSALVGPRVRKHIETMGGAKENQYFGPMVAFQDIGRSVLKPIQFGRKRKRVDSF